MTDNLIFYFSQIDDKMLGNIDIIKFIHVWIFYSFPATFFTEFFQIFSVVEEDAKYMAKRKMLGNIKFMGELGKMEIVHDTILHR